MRWPLGTRCIAAEVNVLWGCSSALVRIECAIIMIWELQVTLLSSYGSAGRYSISLALGRCSRYSPIHFSATLMISAVDWYSLTRLKPADLIWYTLNSVNDLLLSLNRILWHHWAISGFFGTQWARQSEDSLKIPWNGLFARRKLPLFLDLELRSANFLLARIFFGFSGCWRKHCVGYTADDVISGSLVQRDVVGYWWTVVKRLRCDIAISRRRERGGSLGWACGACDCRYAISRYRIGEDGGVNRLDTRRLRSPIADFAMSHRRGTGGQGFAWKWDGEVAMRKRLWRGKKVSKCVWRAFEVSEGVRLLPGGFILRKESIVYGRWFRRLGSCLVSDKLSNSRDLLWLFLNQGEGILHRGIYLILIRGRET